MPRVLFIQSGNVENAAKALDVVKNTVFKSNLVLDYLADDIRPFPPKKEIPSLDKFIHLKAGLFNIMIVLYSLLPTKYDAVVIMFTREPGYMKHKVLAILTRRKRLLIFNDNTDCFFYEHVKMYRHLQWRWREYVNSGKNRSLRLLRDSKNVIQNEGIKSFVTKAWNILMVNPRRVAIPKLKKQTGPLTFPLHDNPMISIVIPVYNKILYTMNCLASIIENTPDISYEVIVVDDKSTDDTPKRLGDVKNIKVIRADQNSGFIGSCNTGAAEARGDYIIFLNNDTTVTPRWLSSPAAILDRDKQCGAVGSKLVYPDGRLQEAGGIIWSDARGWNYGKFQDPEKSEFNYVREVDYCSGASLMVRRSLFEQLGGFDKRYTPAYWEDTDLCFSIRKLGYKVLYQPASVIIHYEGISAGTSMSSGMKKHQELNAPKFIEKWQDELDKQFMNGQEVFLARDRNRNKRILIIDHYSPTYDKDAGSFFMFSLLRTLIGLGYRIVFWPENLFRSEPYTSELQQMGIEVIYGPNKFQDYMEIHGKFFDCAIITRTHIAIHFVDTVKKHVPKIIYHAPDFEYIREKRRFKLENGPAEELEKIKDREFYLFENCDISTTLNADEAEMIRCELPGKEVVVIHHPIDKITDMTTPFEDRCDLLFVGSSHPPNADAMVYYATEILPLLLKILPGIKIYVVGGNPNKRLKELASENFILTGFVKDLLPYFEQCKVYLAPLKYGAGVKGKIIEAMSYGLPVVTTPVGAEGLGVSNNEHMLIEETTEDIVKSVVKLYGDADLWWRLSNSSKLYIGGHYSQEAFREKVKNVMDSIL